MEKQGGVVLTDVWNGLKGKQKVQILDQVVDVERRLAATRFSKFGALYYKGDLPGTFDSTSPLYIDSTGKEVQSEVFGIGPTNHRSFFDLERDVLDIERGPWSTVTEYMTAIARKEIQTAKAGLRYPLMPEENNTTHASVLWHGDLHTQNIFADPEDPTRIVGIVDWQSVSTCPLFMQVGRPAFLDYNGPAPDNLGKVPLPSNFDSMGQEDQQRAKALHQAQTLHNLYLVRCLQRNETVFQAIQGQNSLRHQVSVTPGLVLMDYEPLLSSLLRDVKKEWASIVAVKGDGSPVIPFPLQFSNEEIGQQEEDGELWAQGVELMNAFVDDTGCFKHWDGRVSDVDSEQSRKQLDEGVQRFLDREARNMEERREWLKALPFVD